MFTLVSSVFSPSPAPLPPLPASHLPSPCPHRLVFIFTHVYTIFIYGSPRLPDAELKQSRKQLENYATARSLGPCTSCAVGLQSVRRLLPVRLEAAFFFLFLSNNSLLGGVGLLKKAFSLGTLTSLAEEKGRVAVSES